MSLFVKICGITDLAGLEAAVEAGADAVGFVFHAPSSRNLVPAAAAQLAVRLPRSMMTVAVTLHPDQRLVDEVLAALQPDAWQSDAADFAGLEMPGEMQRWPVYRSGKVPQAPPRRLLFEGAQSGAGQVADWSLAAQWARATELILGGGLTPSSVAAAVKAVRPFGVDVSSGVELAPGRKDPQRVGEFVTAARAAVGVG
jgi:phosphoribosylanthranilate isomerase